MHELFERKEYFKQLTLNDAQINFKYRSKMLDVKMNYKSDKKHMAELWKFSSCETSIESQDHVMWCPAYVVLRVGKSIDNDQDLIDYLKKVMIVRDKLKISK